MAETLAAIPAGDSQRWTSMVIGKNMVRPAITTREGAEWREAARLMLMHRVDRVLVVDPAGKLVGVVAEADLTGRERGSPWSTRRLRAPFVEWATTPGISASRDEARTTAGQVMTKDTFALTENDTVTAAVGEIIRRGVDYLPVTRDGAPVGIVTRHHLLARRSTAVW
jgi:CBS domain-containing protein